MTLTHSQKQILAFKKMNLLAQAVLARPIVLIAVFFADLR